MAAASLRKNLYILITAGSVVGFISSWVLLAHAPKPAADQTAPALAAPAPRQPQQLQSPPNSLQPLPTPAPFRARPSIRLRTGGS